jgi:tRNA pseudouridine55 synthase
MRGLILIDKPPGWTSFDVVNYARKLVAGAEGKRPMQVKVGHAGTLDPFATGLLLVLIGKDFTRRAEEFSKLDKTYKVTMKLGETSSTGDPEGEISLVNERVPNEIEVRTALERFVGEIKQTPPIYSAIKVGGQRAYKLARAGKDVKLEARRVTINSLELISYEYPEVRFMAGVSSGTYIRSLVEDVGRELGTGAYANALRRTQIGDFSINDSQPPTAEYILGKQSLR